MSAKENAKTESRAVEPPGWPRPRGYSNGMVAEGRVLFIAGQVGWDARGTPPKFAKGFSAQFELALSNVLEVLRAAGGAAENLVRVTLYVTDKHEYRDAIKEVGIAWRRMVGNHYPAMTLVEVSGLLEKKAKVEIEATAVL